jgi:dolichyl-phosphate-mannose-protein mannosyltransferase
VRSHAGISALGAVVFAGLLLRLALLPVAGERGDVATFVGWTQLVNEYGPRGLYTHVEPYSRHLIDYPPGYAIVLTVIARFYAAFFLGSDQHEIVLRALLKAPAILADLGLCVLAYSIVRRWGSPKNALLAAAIAAFGPATWLISGLWGQVDSVAAVFLLLAIALVLNGSVHLGWAMLALAMLVKPQPIVVAPLLLAYQIRHSGVSWKLATGPLLAIALAYVVSLPFAPTASPLPVLGWLLSRYEGAIGLYPFTSVSAFNIYTLIGHRYMPDGQQLLALPVKVWGDLAFGALTTGVVALSTRRLLANDRAAGEKVLIAGCFIILTGLFVLTTRMHERYLFSAIALTPLVWFSDPRQRLAIATLVTTFTVNCAIDLFGLINVEHHGIGLLMIVVSALNVATLTALTYQFASEANPSPSAEALNRSLRTNGSRADGVQR